VAHGSFKFSVSSFKWLVVGGKWFGGGCSILMLDGQCGAWGIEARSFLAESFWIGDDGTELAG
jgi:hypothetical protein